MNLQHTKRLNFSLLLCSILFLIVNFICSTAGVALGSDRQQPLAVTAGSAKVYHNTGLSIYQGNVKVDQGSTHLTSDSMNVHTNSENHIEEVIAIANHSQLPLQLATYRTIPELGKSEFYAKAEIIKYYPYKNKVLLIGRAEAIQNKDTFSGNTLEYDTLHQIVTTPPSKEGQATIILHPQTTPANNNKVHP